MNKMNKKGFTLIEMLVVIAIIAILVSIIIPAVSSSSQRAAAAADAANLRSAKAVISIGLLDGTYQVDHTGITAEACEIPAKGKYNGEAFTGEIVDGKITVKYGQNDIDKLADIADNGKADNSNGAAGNKVEDPALQCGCTNYEASGRFDYSCKNCGHYHGHEQGPCPFEK